MHAACDFVADAHNGCVVDRAWTQAARADGISRVRVALNCDAAGMVPWRLFRQGLDAWRAAGVATDVLFSYEYLPPFNDKAGLHYPNEPLGTGNYQLTSHYIERFRLAIERHAPRLLTTDDGVIIWNEPQINLVAPGDNCPPKTRRNSDGATRPDPSLNSSSLAPEVYAALVWQSCHSLEHVGCSRRIAGALSVLPQTGLDARNPYLLAYLRRVYLHLTHCGVKPNWTHLALNCEGYWTAQTAQHMHDTIQGFMDANGDHAQLIITEWGVRNAGMDGPRLLATGIALEATFGQANFFSRPGDMPYLGVAESYPEYGARQWVQDGTAFRLGTWYPAGDVVQQLWKS